MKVDVYSMGKAPFMAKKKTIRGNEIVAINNRGMITRNVA